ncbi:MAG: carbon storage regulator CsrA [Bacillota bacterium]
MLILTRNKEEKIMIGDNIVITVLDVAGDKVQLGIDAPREIEVHREEVYRRIEEENRQAVEVKFADLKEAAIGPGKRGKEDDEVK